MNSLLKFRNPVVHRVIRNFQQQFSNTKRQLSEASSENVVRIGCASGFWGDTPTAVPQLVTGGNINYLVLDYLSEITMSLLVAAQQKSSAFGWCPDFAHSVGPMLAEIKRKGIKVITNAGGINCMSCMEAMSEMAKKAGTELKIAVVLGDDLLKFKTDLGRDGGMPNPATITSLNAYLGAGPIARALELGADVVICGRCTDSALALGPLMHSFKWSWTDWDKIAAGSLAGHLIECGAQSTGGICTEWGDVQGWENNGFPIAECRPDGSIVITKPKNTGGKVDRCTVAEQMLYEIHDPSRYVLPDGICDFSHVQVTDQGNDRVLVTGARGLPPTPFYKVGGTHHDGWKCTSVCPIIGPQAASKGRKTAEALLKRCSEIFKRRNVPDFTRTHVQVIGSEDAYGVHARPENLDTRDAALWMAVHHQDRKALEIFAREIASAGTGMAPGLTTIIGGRPKPSAVLRFFSYLHPKNNLPITIKLSDGQEEIFNYPSVDVFTSPEEIEMRVIEEEPATSVAIHKHCRLGDIAWTRSGDKGDTCNIGVIAKNPSDYSFLVRNLTADKVANYLSHKFPAQVPHSKLCKRYIVPGVYGLNFVLESSLGGGGIASLNPDPQGKGYGQMLLDLEFKS